MKSVLSLKSLAAGLLLLAAGLLLSACSKPPAVEEPVRAVKVLTVGVQSMQSGAEFAGEVRARVESRLGFRVGGKLIERTVELGQHVRAGQLLARLDPQDYELAVAAARAQLALVASNRDLAAADFQRFKELREQNFISSAELERRHANLKVAQAQFAQAEAQLFNQRNQASYTHLTADVAGVVTAVEAEAGQVVAAGAPVVRMAQDGPRDVLFAVPEDKVAALKLGSPVQVRVWPAGTLLQGVVHEVAASADPVTRTFTAKVALGSHAVPALGSTVTVLAQALQHSGEPVVKLPTTALRQDGKSSAVWVLDPVRLTVRLQAVEVAAVDGNQVVLASGLQPGMQVVATGVHVLSPGQTVTIYQGQATDADSASLAR